MNIEQNILCAKEVSNNITPIDPWMGNYLKFISTSYYGLYFSEVLGKTYIHTDRRVEHLKKEQSNGGCIYKNSQL